jgi:hypothetical protein
LGVGTYKREPEAERSGGGEGIEEWREERGEGEGEGEEIDQRCHLSFIVCSSER